MTVDLSDLPPHVTVAVGRRKEVSLPSYSGAGNTWSATCVSGQGVAKVSVELRDATAAPPPPGDGTSEPPPLMLVPERAVVAGLASGEANWRLVLARPFNHSKPLAAHDLRVTVVAGP